MDQTNRRNVTIAIMVAMFLAAIEGTIVSTAMPTIASDLGGLNLISWVFAVYLLTSSVTAPIYGKLADLFGRKRVFIVGTILFLLGSMLSGLSQTMQQLIWYRAFQGIGAGAVLPLTFTIIGDIYTFEQRAKVQGLFSSIWGISGILGPLVGGFLVDYISWRWIFYINVPFGIVSILLIQLYLKEHFEKKRKRIDYFGALTFTIGVTALLYALLSGGQSYPWNSPVIIGLFIAAAISLAIFVRIEAKIDEPMLPLKLFTIRVISISNTAGFLASGVLIGISAYLPVWIQGIYGAGATSSGFTLAPMSIGWPLGATIGGRLMVKAGTRKISFIGMLTILLGCIWLSQVSISTPHWVFIILMVIIGFGFGFAFTAFTVSVQTAVGWNLRGAATASNTFLRTLGQTVFVAIFGTMFNHSLVSYISTHLTGNISRTIDINKLVNPEFAKTLPPDIHQMLRQGLAASLHGVFWASLLISIAGFILILWLPREMPEKQAA